MMGPFHALHLALFYFNGTYYHFSKRLVGARYMLIRKLRQGENSNGYELLGVLICIQMLTVAISKKTSIDSIDFEYFQLM
jgi:peroxin-10